MFSSHKLKQQGPGKRQAPDEAVGQLQRGRQRTADGRSPVASSNGEQQGLQQAGQGVQMTRGAMQSGSACSIPAASVPGYAGQLQKPLIEMRCADECVCRECRSSLSAQPWQHLLQSRKQLGSQ